MRGLLAAVFAAWLFVAGVLTGWSVYGDQAHTLTEFLEQDQSDTMPYTDDFNCVQFSHLLAHNAQQAGYEAYMVVIDSGTKVHHAITGIQIEGGVVFIEPQDDKVKGFLYLPGTRTFESIKRNH